MWLSLCLYIIISITIIVIAHYLLNFLKENLTVTKHRDVFHSQIEKYKNIIEEMENTKIENGNESEYVRPVDNEENELLSFANQCLQE